VYDIHVWHITPSHNTKLTLDASTLDEVTRQLPDGYYSTFRTFEECTRVLGLASHFRRLYEPVPTPNVDESFLRRQLFALLEPYRPGEARVRAVMTGQGQIYLAIAPLAPLPHDIYENGVRVETTELQREQPRLKSTAFIGRSDMERKHIAREGIFEALLVKGGEILEGMTSNFFYIRYQRASSAGRQRLGSAQAEAILCTARDHILLGITRETVIAIARGIGLELKYVPLSLDQLTEIDEAFITSSSRGIVPVVQIDDVTIGQGSPGPTTKQLSQAYEARVVEEAEKIM